MPRDEPWFRNAFDELYLVVYRHRDGAEAASVVSWAAAPTHMRGARVLDVACGAGRFSEAVLAAGARSYSGIDLSAPLLEAAVRAAPQAAARAFARADMRALPVRSASVDVVLSMFSSLGYFATDRENSEGVAEMARVLVPGGRALVDLMNAPLVAATLVPVGERETEGYRVREERALEGDRIVKRVAITRLDGSRVRHYVESVRLISKDLLEAWCGRVGLRLAGTWGDYGGGTFDPSHSPRLIAAFVREGARDS